MMTLLRLWMIALLVGLCWAQEEPIAEEEGEGGVTPLSLATGLTLGAVFGVMVSFGFVIMMLQLRVDPTKRDVIFDVCCCQAKKKQRASPDVYKMEVELDKKEPQRAVDKEEAAAPPPDVTLEFSRDSTPDEEESLEWSECK